MFFPDDSRTISPYANLAAECVNEEDRGLPGPLRKERPDKAQNI
jgi:hypothetical protein